MSRFHVSFEIELPLIKMAAIMAITTVTKIRILFKMELAYHYATIQATFFNHSIVELEKQLSSSGYSRR